MKVADAAVASEWAKPADAAFAAQQWKQSVWTAFAGFFIDFYDLYARREGWPSAAIR